MEIRKVVRMIRTEPYPYEFDSYATEYDMEDEEYEADEIEDVNWDDYKEMALNFLNGFDNNRTPNELPEYWKVVIEFAVSDDTGDYWIQNGAHDCEESLDNILK